MPSIAHYTNPRLIVPKLRGRDPEAVIEELCEVLTDEGRVPDSPRFQRAVIQHEMQSHTATSPGLALPHARMDGLPHLCFALGRSAIPLHWFGQSAERVQMVFLFAVPEFEAMAYLTLISGMARLSKDLPRLQRLLQAPDCQAMFEILQQVQVPTCISNQLPARSNNRMHE